MPVSVSKLNRMAAKLVVPYSEEHALAHAEFAARNWPDNALRRDPRYNRWKFRSPDAGPIEGLLLAIRDKKVIGQVGLTPLKLHSNGVDFAAQWLSDFMVDPAFRVMGVGPMLIAKAVSTDLPTLADTPTAESRPVIKGLGFIELKGPQRFFLPSAQVRVASGLAGQTILRKQQRLAPVVAPLLALYLTWRARRLRQRKHRHGLIKCRWEELADLVIEAQRKNAAPHVVHDAEFLSWRCLRLGEGLDGMHGLRTPTGGYVLFGSHRADLFVFDWAASNREESRALFSAVWDAGRHLGADTLTVLANTSQEQEWLQSLGFFSRKKPIEVFCFSPQDSPLPSGRLHFCHLDAHANL